MKYTKRDVLEELEFFDVLAPLIILFCGLFILYPFSDISLLEWVFFGLELVLLASYVLLFRFRVRSSIRFKKGTKLIDYHFSSVEESEDSDREFIDILREKVEDDDYLYWDEVKEKYE